MAGEENGPTPGWYRRGLGYDDEKDREEADPADAEQERGDHEPAGDEAAGDSDEEGAADSETEEVMKPLILKDPGHMSVQEYDAI